MFNSLLQKRLKPEWGIFEMNSSFFPIKSKKRILYNILFIAMCFCMFASCKSHNKASKYDDVYLGESVKVKNPVKKSHGHPKGKEIAEESLSWIGTPYGYGHSEKGVSTDCSGLVLVIYRDIAEIKLPRNSAEQADFCKELKEKEIEPGDLVFFATGKDAHKVSHVGVMIDECRFVHASTKGVIISEMTTPYYQRTFIKYGRVPF